MQGIETLGRKKYRVRVSARDRHGERHWRSKTVKGSKSDAKAVRDDLLAELEEELNGPAPKTLTLSVYAQQWLERRVARLKPSTVVKYLNDLERHILPALGGKLLRELRPSDIDDFLSRDPGAPNSRMNRLRLLRTIAKDALADRIIEFDFCARITVKVPKVYSAKQPNRLTEEQLDTLLAVIGDNWLDVVVMLAFTGLRWGEISGLRWSDLDLEAGTMNVGLTNWKGELQVVKTAASERVIPLADPLPELLRRRYQRMVAENHPGLSRDLVFPTRQGTLHRGTPLRAVLIRTCKKAGIKFRFTTHGLRRTWNNLARKYVSGLVVRSIMGHTSERMTDHYSHVEISEKRAAAAAVLHAVSPERLSAGAKTVPAGGATPAGDHEKAKDFERCRSDLNR